MENASLEYDAGFLDGDGSVQLAKPSERHANPLPRIQVAQSYHAGVPPELERLRVRYGGYLRCDNPKKTTHRPSWRLYVGTLQTAPKLLGVITRYGITKARQASRALEYMTAEKRRPGDANALYELLKRAKSEYADAVIDPSKITIPYIAGLFSADGSIGTGRKRDKFEVIASIRQKSCPRLLHAIRDALGFGHVNKCGQLTFSGQQARKLAMLVRPYMDASQKAAQIDALMKYDDENTWIRRGPRGKSVEQLARDQELVNDMRRLKRQ